jgi:hypothetical protein
LFAALILLLTWRLSAFGIHRPPPTKLTISEDSIVFTFDSGRRADLPWRTVTDRLVLEERPSEKSALTEFRLVTLPTVADILIFSRRILPMAFLSRNAADAVLAAARGVGLQVHSRPLVWGSRKIATQYQLSRQ